MGAPLLSRRNLDFLKLLQAISSSLLAADREAAARQRPGSKISICSAPPFRGTRGRQVCATAQLRPRPSRPGPAPPRRADSRLPSPPRSLATIAHHLHGSPASPAPVISRKGHRGFQNLETTLTFSNTKVAYGMWTREIVKASLFAL